MKRIDPLVIFGPTGSGKSKLSMLIACELDCEIVACDSVQVYRGFDIGSAKPSQKDRAAVPHHLLDCCDHTDDFNAATYGKLAKNVIAEIQARQKVPLIVAGTGLYLHAAADSNFSSGLGPSPTFRSSLDETPTVDLWRRLQQKDSDLAATLHEHDRVRLIRALEKLHFGETVSDRKTLFQLPSSWFMVAIEPRREDLWQRIEVRSQEMIDMGLIDETWRLIGSGVPIDSRPMASIGYAQTASYLAQVPQKHDLSDLRDKIVIATRQYAKRQRTWFKKLSRNITLTEAVDQNAASSIISSYLRSSY